jgi:pimeloyl-ACP methyl ester carboxylesterase
MHCGVAPPDAGKSKQAPPKPWPPSLPTSAAPPDRLSARWLIALAARLIRDVGTLPAPPKPLDPNRWANITAPALVIYGGKSPQYMRNAAKALSEQLPKARRQIEVPNQKAGCR